MDHGEFEAEFGDLFGRYFERSSKKRSIRFAFSDECSPEIESMCEDLCHELRSSGYATKVERCQPDLVMVRARVSRPRSQQGDRFQRRVVDRYQKRWLCAIFESGVIVNVGIEFTHTTRKGFFRRTTTIVSRTYSFEVTPQALRELNKTLS